MVAIALVIVRWGYSWIHPAPDIPVPADLDQLQPQLRAYVLQLVQEAKAAPRDLHSHATLGIAYASNQLWPEAKVCFENAARLAPEEPLAHLYVAVATEELGDYSEALRLYHELTVRFPSFPQGFYRVGKLALQLGSIEEAKPAFTRLVELAPNEWRGHAGLGEIALRQGDPAAASTHLEKAVALDPQAGNAHSLLGLAYRGLGREEEAALELARGEDSQNFPMPDPWGKTAHQHMRLVQDQIEIAQRYSIEGEVDRAINILANAAFYSPTNLALLNALAVALNRANRPDQAQVVLNQLFTQNDGYLPGVITASLVARNLGQTNESLAFANRAVLLAPKSAHSHVALANALLASEKDQEAVEALLEAARYDPKNAELQLEVGDLLLLNLNRPDEALDHYQTACDLKPTLVSAQIHRAQVLIEKGRVGEAEQVVTLICKLEPTHPALPLLRKQLQQTNSVDEAASLSNASPKPESPPEPQP